MEKAVILLSGGMDSATVLAVAQQETLDCYALSFDYGQRHGAELIAARQIAEIAGVTEHRTIRLDLGQLGGSALTDTTIAVPETESDGIPVTYVPARNTVFLSYGLAWAEVLDAEFLYVGVNAVDYSGYPDCRPEYVAAFQAMANLATRRAVNGRPVKLVAPLIDLGKQQIVELGTRLGVEFSLTVSCYQADNAGAACGRCDACRLRRAGFTAAQVVDPTRYQA